MSTANFSDLNRMMLQKFGFKFVPITNNLHIPNENPHMIFSKIVT